MTLPVVALALLGPLAILFFAMWRFEGLVTATVLTTLTATMMGAIYFGCLALA